MTDQWHINNGVCYDNSPTEPNELKTVSFSAESRFRKAISTYMKLSYLLVV